MSAIGGPIQEVTVGGRLFAVAADANATRNLGGFSNDIEPNGNGSARMIKKREAWEIGGLSLAIDDANGDHEYLQSIANSLDWTNSITIKLVSGIVYQGKGTITDKVEMASDKATASLKFGGPGELTQQ